MIRVHLTNARWRASYLGHLVLLSLLDALRYMLTAFTLATHRLHTRVAEHGETVADILGATHYTETTELDRARYMRLVKNLLSPGETE